MVILKITGDGMFVYGDNLDFKLSGYEVKKFFTSNQLIFANLKKNGPLLLNFLKQLGVTILSIGMYDGSVQIIRTKHSSIKCYISLGYSKSDCCSYDILLYLTELDKFLYDRLSTTLNQKQIISIASISTNLLKKKTPEIFLNLGDDVLAQIKKSFFGGRCELFWPGTHKNAFMYDFVSMYGSLMLLDYPTIVGNYENFLPKHLGQFGFFDATILQNQPVIPLLPIKIKSNIFFLNGKFRGCF